MKTKLAEKPAVPAIEQDQTDMGEVLLSILSQSKILYIVTPEGNRFMQDLNGVFADKANTFHKSRKNELWYWSAGLGLRRVDGRYAFLPSAILLDPTIDMHKIYPCYGPDEQKLMESTMIAAEALNHIHKELTKKPTDRPSTDTEPYHRIIVLNDFSYFASMDPTAVARLKDIIEDPSPLVNLSFIILSNKIEIPPMISSYVEVLDYSLPSRAKIETLVRKAIDLVANCNKQYGTDGKVDYTAKEIKVIVDSCMGLSSYEINVQLRRVTRKCKFLDPKEIIKAKEQIVKKSDVIQYIHSDVTTKDIGGLSNVKQWFKERKASFSDDARAFGIDAPRGVLMVGMPGVGKSLIAKTLGNEWGVPILHLDVGKVMSGLVGSSEQRIREAVKTAEAIGQCILWVDEVEKGFSGVASSSYSDGGTMARVFGYFLTWMQEKKSDVFVVATANSIMQLPPEMLRRFDEIFFVDFPGEEERVEIFDIHLNKRHMDTENLDLPLLAKETKGYSGSEVERVVRDAMYMAFNSPERKLTTNMLLTAAKQSIPLSESMKDMIDRVRDIASKMRFASDKSEHAHLNPRKANAPVARPASGGVEHLIE